MYKNKQNALTAKILSSIPKNIKPTEYLMEMLSISKESAYRRLRGEIPFTFAEIKKMAIDLHFSVDEIISRGASSHVSFSVDVGQAEEDYPVFAKTIRDYYDGLITVSNAQESEIIVAMNNILPFFFTPFESLFKFSYFKSMQKNAKIASKSTFADTVLPNDLLELRTRIEEQLKNCTKNVTIIIDSNIVSNLISDILYFHKRRLITDDELQILKKEMLTLIDQVEEMAQSGFFSDGIEVNIYLSFINVDSSSLYMKNDDKEVSCFYLYNLAPITATNQSICALHRKKVDSLKKYSRLITQSNEIIQSAFFEHQREKISLIEEQTLGISF